MNVNRLLKFGVARGSNMKDKVIKRKNKIIEMDTLPKKVQKDIKRRKVGLFHNTFIVDKPKDMLYVYTREGECQFTNAEMAHELAEFEWYIDKEGYAATDDLPHIRENIRMHSFVYIYYNMAPDKILDDDGKLRTDWHMAEFIF